ncbi:MAG: polyphosphate polymerase domain-containing protein [Pirellulaceae bacterium]
MGGSLKNSLPLQKQWEPPFQLTEISAVDPTFAGRREIKYLLDRSNLDLARELMESRFERVVFNRPVSVVRSIYFDTEQLATCHANLDGVGRRNKVRLRWYDQPLPDQHVYFEVKWRRNLVTGKFRTPLTLQRPLADISYHELRRGLQIVLPDSSQALSRIYDQPIVLVEYQREHFMCQDLGLRLTLDYDLMFYDQAGFLRPELGMGISLPGLALIEAKSVPPAPRDLSRLLQPLGQRVSRCSKYVHGCAQIGRIPVAFTW